MSDSPIVLDASALLALFHKEPGMEKVRQAVRSRAACISAVNYAEVATKHVAKGKNAAILREIINRLGVSVIEFDQDDAQAVGELKPRTREWGLSLADCACLALSKRLGAAALTADLAWMNLKDEYNVEPIRKRSSVT